MTMECLKEICLTVVKVYGKKYLRRPSQEDAKKLMAVEEQRDFPRNVRLVLLHALGTEELPYLLEEPVKKQRKIGNCDAGSRDLLRSRDLVLFLWSLLSLNEINFLNCSHLLAEAAKGRSPLIDFFRNKAVKVRNINLRTIYIPDMRTL